MPETGLLKGCSWAAPPRHPLPCAPLLPPLPPKTLPPPSLLPRLRCYEPTLFVSLVCVQTLERSYMLRVNGKVVERPQHMLMRVAVGIHMEDVDAGG
jgi:hypothetical protein